MKPCSDNNKNYFPAENDEAKHYVFEEIVKSSVDKFEKINKSTTYVIKING